MTPDLWLGLMILAGIFLLEGMVPFYQPRPRRLRHGAVNASLALLNGLVGALTAPLIVLAVELGRANDFGIARWLGLSPMQTMAAGLLLMDLWMYWWHRANHRFALLWRLHRVHHTDPALDSTTALRFHPGELLIYTLLNCAVIVALGLGLDTVILYQTVMIAVTLIHHSNIALPDRLDRRLRRILVAPSVHRVHHSEVQAETDSNYGSIFSFWDRLFGTFRLRTEQMDIRFGIGAFEGRRWQTPEGLLLLPLEPIEAPQAPDDDRLRDALTK